MRLVNIAVLMSLIICPALTNAELAKDLRVTASPWSPYVSRDLPGHGIAVSIVTTVLKRAGYKTSFALKQWPKDLEGTRLGEHDVIASIWFTDERAKDLVFSEPFFENRIKLLVRTDSDIKLSRPEALKGYRIGVVEDYAYTQGAYRDLQVEIVKSALLEENLQRLLAGDIDIAVSDEQVALYTLNNKIPGGIRKIRFARDPLTTRRLHMAVSRKHADAEQIVSDFNTALQQMKDDGTYLDILHQFRISP
ncbi:MAG: transporter substrate-binding domain-containing protein [Gammaproteobacteria bacterium]|nr:transporter substrate-binding domain-containing protein [Gammaproteobacteria bacterium]